MALGGQRETFAGLAGMGDLIVTCTSMNSRNYRAGILIGQGVPVPEAIAKIGAVVEGYYAVDAARALAQKVGVEMPITEAAYEVLYQGRDPEEAILTPYAAGKAARDRGRPGDNRAQNHQSRGTGLSSRPVAPGKKRNSVRLFWKSEK